MIDTQLVRAVNTGQAIAFVGSGPSSQLGLPSWEKIAKEARALVKRQATSYDEKGYDRFLSEGKYPELLSQFVDDLSYDALCDLFRSLLKLSKDPTFRGSTYEFLARWPFAFYLTTNLDDLLFRALRDAGIHNPRLGNSPAELATLRADTRDAIVHLHGMVDGDADSWVITSAQYNAVLTAPDFEYLRHKLQTLFEMFTVVIVGYSLKDPDIDFIMRTASVHSDPSKPVYMFVADATDAEVKDLHRTKNIVAYRYDSEGGSHRQLRSLLRTIDRFVPHRAVPDQPPDAHALAEELTLPLYLYTTLQLRGETGDLTRDLYKYLFVSSLSGFSSDTPKQLSTVASQIPLPAFGKGEYDAATMNSAVEDLVNDGVVEVESETQGLSLTPKGAELLDTTTRERQVLEDQVFGQAELDLVRRIPDIGASTKQTFLSSLRQALVQAFSHRGLDFASAIFGARDVDLTEALEVFECLKQATASLPTLETRAFFIEYGTDFLVNPTDRQKAYLWHLSQAWFAYHALNLDPTGAAYQAERARESVWVIDSSVILPLLARNSHNHDYARDLFERIKALEIKCYTTEKLFDEVEEHYRWALRRVGEFQADSAELLRMALIKPPYRQNLFVDGFIRTAAQSPDLTLQRYLDDILNSYATIQEAIRQCLAEYGVQVVGLSEWPGFDEEDYAEIEEIATQIGSRREALGTYRRREQVVAEAEVYKIICGERDGRYGIAALGESTRALFISQSLSLNALDAPGGVTTWRPEGFYRYLLTFPATRPTPDLLAQCMLQDFYYAGVEVIDTASYERYFMPVISQSRLSFQKVKDDYEHGVFETYSPGYEEAFDKTPDLEKPFFVSTLLSRELETRRVETESLRERIGEAEKRVVRAEGSSALSVHERELLDRLKGRQAERAAKRTQRKRARASNKRKRRRGR